MSLSNAHWGVVGCGNMARGMLAGMTGKGLLNPKNILVYDVKGSQATAFKRTFGVRIAGNVAAVFKASDAVLLAVKPQQLSEALAGINTMRGLRTKLMITILAGTPRKKVASYLPKSVRIVRAMPNLGATVGASMTAITGGARGDLVLVEKLFSSFGEVVRVPESYMDLVTVLSGSGPAYFYLLMEMISREGVRYGLSEKTAALLARQTALGAAKLAAASAVSPETLRRQVTSKGGTTEAAIRSLEKDRIRRIFSKAITRALKRARDLGRRN